MSGNDEVLEHLFGPPRTAAADLNELRVWAHGRTALNPTTASQAGRELCVRIDPSWPARALTNERVKVPAERRPRGYGIDVLVAESTIETLTSVAAGARPITTKKRSSKLFETLWPAQSSSWRTWVLQAQDLSRGLGGPEMRSHDRSLSLPYVTPAAFMVAVRKGGTPYLDRVGDHMELGREVWKFGCVDGLDDLWSMGLSQFRREWLDLFPLGELAMWLRSSVCNGWFTSHQLARYMGLETARSCTDSWI